MFFFFFFQAEDGIRDLTVTGVQTCALPISWGKIHHSRWGRSPLWRSVPSCPHDIKCTEATRYPASHSPLVMPVVSFVSLFHSSSPECGRSGPNFLLRLVAQ